MTAWYIDALDPRGGLAFTSHRDADLFPRQSGRDETAALDQQTVFLSPPYFQPSRGPTRAVALAAARGSFQSGFVLGEDEVPFATLEDVIEFVRRVYMSSVGGDGGGGGAGGGEGETPGPRFPIEGGGEGGEPIQGPPGLRDAVSIFADKCQSLKLGEKGSTCDWTQLASIRSSGSSQSLNDVAVLLICERLRSLPLNASNPAALLDWLRRSNATGLLLDQMDLLGSAVHAIIRHPRGDGIRKLLLSFAGAWKITDWHSKEATEYPGNLLYDLFTDFADWSGRYRGSWAWISRMRALNETFDQVEVLRRVTLPEQIAKDLTFLAKAAPKELSLYHLLFTMIANPALIKKCGDEATVGWLLVLASVLLTGRRATAANAARPASYDSPISAIRDLAMSEALAAGAAWLAANLPKRALPAVIEAQIGRAMALRYETASVHA
jgi:hypothetical protein